MSRPHWAKRWILLAALSVGGGFAGLASEPAGPQNGPAPAKEAALLWEQGQAAHSDGRNGDCVHALSRLVERHVGAAHYLRAHLLLGQCWLRQGHAQEALDPLRHFVEDTKVSAPDGVRGRLDLARAQIDLGHYPEAQLQVQELLRKIPQGEERGEALLIKSSALIGLGHDSRAREALSAFPKEGGNIPAGPLTAWAAFLDIRLKVHECAAMFPGPSSEEGKLLGAYRSTGQCFQEATLKLRSAVDAESSPPWLARARDDLKDGLQAYSAAISMDLPAPPGKSKPRGRKQIEQLAEYYKELRAALQQEWTAFAAQENTRLDEWNKAAPGADSTYITPVRKAMP